MDEPDRMMLEKWHKNGMDQDLSVVLFWGLAATSLILTTLLAVEIWSAN
ncbi:MAG: hypothetical protein HQL91_04170 [Magnetococcales bacterium]|nr:hypothetical protein [Magnetococcales bacterium]